MTDKPKFITFERAEKAAEYIRDHSKTYGELVGHCKSLEHQRKVVKGQEFLKTQGTVAEREARADDSAAFRSVVEDIENAWAEKTEIETMLEYSRIICDLYRTTEATARTIDKTHR
jgi:hypothetical protein